MTASIVLGNYKFLEDQKQEDLKTVSDAVKSIQSEYASFFSKAEKEAEKDYKDEYRKVLAQTAMSLKKCANSSFKQSAVVEVHEIEQIKNSLSNYSKDDEKVKAFKKEIIGELTSFQKAVEASYTSKMQELRKQQRFYARKVLVLDAEKNALIMGRLSRILWPYDAKTKRYDAEIEHCRLQVKSYTQKIQELNASRPSASEKDLLIYQMKMKEKYADLF